MLVLWDGTSLAVDAKRISGFPESHRRYVTTPDGRVIINVSHYSLELSPSGCKRVDAVGEAYVDAPYAYGYGRYYALGALAAGADVVEAAKIVKRYCSPCAVDNELDVFTLYDGVIEHTTVSL